VLKAHPQVIDAVVVPVSDERFGYVPYAFLRHRGDLDPDGLVAWWAGRDDAVSPGQQKDGQVAQARSTVYGSGTWDSGPVPPEYSIAWVTCGFT
jgi:hypothetical protein